MRRPDTLLHRLARFLTTPWIFPLFLLIPLLVIVLRILRFPFPGTNLLLANNLLLLVYLVVRLAALLRRAAKPHRYGEESWQPRQGVTIPLTPDAARKVMEIGGYRFNGAETYGEKRDVGFWGTVLVHVGLIILLGFGSYDNTHLFTGSFLHGVGKPVPLYDKNTYGFWSKGLLTSYSDIDMKLRVKERFLPSSRYPQGAAEVILLDRDDRELQHGIVDPQRPMSQGRYNICMTRFVYDAWVVVTSTGNLVVFTDWVKLLPRPDTSGTYTHYNDFTSRDGKLAWRAWFDQNSDRMRFQIDKDGRRIVDVVLGMGSEARKETGGFVASLQGIGKWTEFRIIRKRHVPVLIAGGVIALAGLLIRLAFRPRRVWIDVEGTSSVIRSTDGSLLKAVASRGTDRMEGEA